MKISSTIQVFTKITIEKRNPKGVYYNNAHIAFGNIIAELDHSYDLLSLSCDRSYTDTETKERVFNYTILLNRVFSNPIKVKQEIEMLFESEDWGIITE